MPCDRRELEARERLTLASYAQFSADTRGRAHREAPPEWRTHYQRDRDRVIHSRAFRRLEYKTQVFLNGTGDHLRTRLTHTMEVAGISRNIARALRLNEDLTETVALAHDLGHSPFGHTGEAALDRLMKEHGGFEHNSQSLRVVELLEQKYPGFAGLNLTWEVREGLAKHSTGFDVPGRRTGFTARSPSLEAQVANLADEITYYSHDLDDGLTSGLLSEDRLRRDVEIWHRADRWVRRHHGTLPDECRRYFIIRCLIDDQVRDVVHTTEALIREAGVKTADDVRQQPQPLVRYSPERRRMNLALRKYLYRNLYYNPEVHEPNRRAVNMLKALFHHFVAHPQSLGERTRRRIRQDGVHRAVCDYLAGMTDRFAIQEHERLFGVKL
ncbi:MAG TPA: deoxyguanosinetriphosphate triphosphohydrolase [Methylomirabilota bacterium]|nr:deoxyguanosinetriphosphate triphosphohydrolase [Methylomirabilota bacterium]